MEIKKKVDAMTLEEKIGQKIMLDFRFWDPEGRFEKDMTAPDSAVESILTAHHIGGVILFSNNLKSKPQIQTLACWYASMETVAGVGLFICTDNEGGSIFRLPRDGYVSFPGNMALAAAVAGGADPELARAQGRWMANDLLSAGINTNFAPVADVNTNPLNPVINVRSFGDDVEAVAELAANLAAGMQQQGLITAYKHFPGHGGASVDSHTALPRVDRSRQDAFAIDIAPYRHAIDSLSAPDMIMTAHLQYPALDDRRVRTRSGEEIIVPATMSGNIQTVILRNELGYAGVTVSDALDMGAIAAHFDQDEAIARVFSAGVDIALMPVSLSAPAQALRLSALIRTVADKVRKGLLDEADIDASVGRILDLKHRYGLCRNDQQPIHAGTPAMAAEAVDKEIADQSITVVVNRCSILPLTDKAARCFILTPAAEQGEAIAAAMLGQGYRYVDAAEEARLSAVEIEERIACCDVFMLGTQSAGLVPTMNHRAPAGGMHAGNGASGHFAWLRLAARLDKVRVHLSLRAPYDIATYAAHVDAAVATYCCHGYVDGRWQGRSMISLAEVLTGKRLPQGKLPVTLWAEYDPETGTGAAIYPSGFGIDFRKEG